MKKIILLLMVFVSFSTFSTYAIQKNVKKTIVINKELKQKKEISNFNQKIFPLKKLIFPKNTADFESFLIYFLFGFENIVLGIMLAPYSEYWAALFFVWGIIFFIGSFGEL